MTTSAPIAPTVLANLTLPLLNGVSREDVPARLIASGFLVGQRPDLPRVVGRRAARARGLGGAGAGAVIQLVVRVGREHADLVLAELMAVSPGGLEEREAGDAIEYVLYGAAGELPDLGEVRATVGGRAIDVSTREVPDGWGEDWRSFHQPIRSAPCASGRRGSRRWTARSTS